MSKLEEKLIELGYELYVDDYKKDVGDDTIVIVLDLQGNYKYSHIELGSVFIELEEIEQLILDLKKVKEVALHDLEELKNVKN